MEVGLRSEYGEEEMEEKVLILIERRSTVNKPDR